MMYAYKYNICRNIKAGGGGVSLTCSVAPQPPTGIFSGGGREFIFLQGKDSTFQKWKSLVFCWTSLWYPLKFYAWSHFKICYISPLFVPPKENWVHAITFKSWKSFCNENGPSIKHFWKVEDIPRKWRTMCNMNFNFLFGPSALTLKFSIFLIFLLAILCSATIQIKKNYAALLPKYNWFRIWYQIQI